MKRAEFFLNQSEFFSNGEVGDLFFLISNTLAGC